MNLSTAISTVPPQKTSGLKKRLRLVKEHYGTKEAVYKVTNTGPKEEE